MDDKKRTQRERATVKIESRGKLKLAMQHPPFYTSQAQSQKKQMMIKITTHNEIMYGLGIIHKTIWGSAGS